MLSVSDLAPALQTLFGADADDLAARTRFCRRERAITGPVFARTLVFGWLGRPDAPLESLAEAAGPASPQAWHARVGPEAADFLERLLARAVGMALGASPPAIPLLRRFAGVYAEDMTDLGPAGKALVRYELSGGRVESLEVLGPRASEVATSAGLPPLPAGSLRLADRGFFDASELRRLSASGVHWVTRVPTGAKVSAAGGRFVPLPDWLAALPGDRADAEVRLCEGGPAAGRLVARRCPPAVAAERLRRLRATAKRKARPVSRAQRVMCRWSVLFTDLPAAGFGPAELEVLYRCRWQVELLFKRFKSLGGVGACRGRRPERHRVETLAKLLAAVVAEWVSLMGGGPFARTGPVGRQRRARASAGLWAVAIGCVRALAGALAVIAAGFKRRAKRRRRKSPSTRQLLFRPRLTA